MSSRRPQAVADLRAAVASADAVLLATPEYNSSIPGALKNALDWASRPIATNVFRGKPVAVIGSSIGMFGAVWAQADLRKVLAAMGARVAEVEVAVGHAHEKFDEDGRLIDEELRQHLGDAVATLAEAADPVCDRGLGLDLDLLSRRRVVLRQAALHRRA